MKRQQSLSRALSLVLMVLTSFCFRNVVRAQEARPRMDSAAADSQARLVVQLGHSFWVMSVAFSPDGKYVLTGSEDNTARLWEAETGKEVRQFVHSDLVRSVAFSPDGKYVLTGSKDKTARLWEAETGKEVRKFVGHEDWINSVAFSPDGKYVLTGSGDKTARLWETETGREVRKFVGHEDWINSVAFSPDGKYLLTGSNDSTARLWETETGQEVRRFVVHSVAVFSVAISSGGQYVLAGYEDKTARLWETETGKEVLQFRGHKSAVLSVTLSPDTKYVLTGGGGKNDKTACLWEVETGKEVRRFEGHSAGISSVVISPDGKYVLSGSADNTARLWEAETGKEVRQFRGQSQIVTSFAFSSDGKYMLTGSGYPSTGSGDNTARLWEAETGKEMLQFRGHSDELNSVAFSPDTKYVLTGSADSTARLWETETGKEVRRFTEYSSEILSVAVSANGKYVLTGSTNMIARLWDAETGKEIRTFEGHSDKVTSVAFSGDGKYVLTCSGDNTARLWETETGKELRKFVGHSKGIDSVAISPDGKKVLTSSGDQTTRLWEAATGKELRQFVGHSYSVTSVAFSTDGKYVLTGSFDNTARLWETETGREVRKFVGHKGWITSVAFSPDGKQVVTGSFDSTTRLWDISTGRELCSLVSFRFGSWAVTDPDGRYDASNNGDVEGMHWVVGNETIALSQLKHRYYEPGLLAKILKGEPLRSVSAFKDVRLFPDVAYQSPAPGSTQLKIKLTNRGGGIGRVTVLVNGKEVTADARGSQLNSQAAKGELTVDLSGAAIKPGQPNSIRVLAYNAEGWLSSRGPVVTWTAPGAAAKYPPELYAIVGGVSTYRTESVNLRYAAKDAEDMARALSVGAKNLFGADKTHITVLSTSGSAGTVRPTKENFKRAFESARKARPGDVLVVYLAGHGLAIRLSGDNDTYCYLTEEWRGSTNLNDEAVRREQSITSDEMVEWIKRVPALKQIMMLDTCAAGAAAGKLKLIDPRLPSSDQVRAIDRLKDRTGFHVLMGSAADKASYETSQFNQGLLTRALLEGMKYGAVKNERVEVSDLFQFARDRVPVLARESGVGGVQQPQIMAPKADSFPVARMTSRESEAIFLTRGKPFVLRPRIINPADVDDDELERAVRRALRDESEPVTRGTAGKESRLVYLDDGELPSAVRPSGTFTVDGDRIKVVMTLKRGEQRVSLEREGNRSDMVSLATKLVEGIAEAMKGFH